MTHLQQTECYGSEGKCFWGYVIKDNAASAWFTSPLALESWVDRRKGSTSPKPPHCEKAQIGPHTKSIYQGPGPEDVQREVTNQLS